MKNLTLLSMGLMLYSCNEKISPELDSGNSTTVGGPTSPATIYSFEVTNETAAVLNYKIHQTGPSNGSVDCKIEDEDFSTTLFKSTPTTYDISCFIEAEEQALYFNGLDLKIKATAGLCENMVYAPYHFFQYQPGSSTRTIDIYLCSEVTSAQALASASPPYDGAGCDQYVQATLAVGVSIPKNLPEAEQEFCDFDYTQYDEDAPNCDPGIVTINEYTYAETAAASCSDPAFTSQATCIGPEVWTPAVYGRTLAIRSVKCGGEIDKCRAGAGLTAISKNYSGIKAINYTTQGAAIEQDVTLASPQSSGYLTNLSVANFVRQCSGPVDNTTLANFEPTSGDTADEINKRLFDPAVLERYAAGRMYWDIPSNAQGAFTTKFPYTALNKLAPVLTPNHYVDTTLGRTRTFYAADSFMGTGAAESSTAPNYTFYCLNDSMDIKARIRIIVREWDRLPAYTSQDFTLLSDAFYQPSATPESARMDTTGTELDEDDNPFNNFNDIGDWDDFLSVNNRCSAPVAGTWYGSGLFIGSGL